MKKLSWFYKYFIFKLKKKINIDLYFFDHKSLDGLLNYFGSDKGTAVKNPYNKDSKKIFGHGFSKFYEKNFKHFREKKFNFLEIGTWEGASLASFAKYFRNAQIYGLDRNFKFKYKSKRITFLNCDTTNNNNLDKFKKNFKNKKFEIIIDDGSHLLSDIIHNFKFFSRFLKKGGYYVVEDYNYPKYYNFLNNTKKELLFDKIIKKIKYKTLFSSSILDKIDQKFFHKNIKNIQTYKGLMKESGRNISNIVFFEFK